MDDVGSFVLITLLTPSGSGFYSRCKVEIVVSGYMGFYGSAPMPREGR